MRRSFFIVFRKEHVFSRSIKSPYICTSCRHSLQQQRSSNIPHIRYASDLPDLNTSSSTEIPEFTPASTWDGLDHVGLERPIFDYDFKPFSKEVRSNKLKDHREIAKAVHQAAVETFTLRAAGKDMNLSREVLEHRRKVIHAIGETRLGVAPESGDITLTYPYSTAEKLIVNELVGEDETPSTQAASTVSQPVMSGPEPESFQENKNLASPAQSHGHSSSSLLPKPRISQNPFKTISLTSLPIKFAIVKRITHLTGHRIPDPALNSLKTLGAVYEYLIRAPTLPSKKLAPRLMGKADVTSLPNVKVSKFRRGLITKEKEVGRLKVINKELESRGLPLLRTRQEVRRIARQRKESK